MPCLNCSASETIRSHLIPQAFAKDVKSGKAFAIVSPTGNFVHSQAGWFDETILCKRCDNLLGKLENYAVRDLGTVRRTTSRAENVTLYIAGIDGNRFIRFCAALLWKFSVTKKKYGRIMLGTYQSTLRQIAFDGFAIPQSVDVLIVRLRRELGDTGMFGYWMPRYDRQFEVNVWRFLVGGCLIFIRLDQRKPDAPFFRDCWIRNRRGVNVAIAPAQYFEEFTKPQSFWRINEDLSRFLDKQDRVVGLGPQK